LISFAVDPQFAMALTAVDKPEVFALKLNGRKFAKNPPDLIRCKFSIDEIRAAKCACPRASTISKP
jgi:hypothetical protein